MTPSYLVMLRPTQWLKNLMLFFPPFLGGQLMNPGLASKGILPFVSFCLASSAGYILNDIIDRERDACHPRKRSRPIPSGAVSIRQAGVIAFAMLLSSLLLSLKVSPVFSAILTVYVVLTASYSLLFKSLPVADLFCIALGFVLRLAAGGVAFHVVITPWLFLCVFLLAVFLSTGKRLCEYRLLGDDAGEHRKSLMRYPPGFLDGTMYMTGGVVLVTYSMYTLSRPKLLYTVPLCAFGLLRYIYRIQSGESGDPTESLLKDRVLFSVGLLWAILVTWSIYW